MGLRARNIKPGFFKNEDLAECTPWARLVFAGLWMLADREGRLEDRPKRIKGELLPYDEQSIEPLLQELHQHGFILRYRNSDGGFIQILKFAKHQTPHYSEKRSVIKPPGLRELPFDEPTIPPGTVQEDSQNSPGTDHPLRGGPNPLNPDSLNPDSLNPEEEGSDAENPTPQPAPSPPAFLGEKNITVIPPRAQVPLAEAWELPERWGTDAEALGFKPAEILREAERFRQYYVAGAAAGKRRTLRGWRQAWSNWLGNAERFPRRVA